METSPTLPTSLPALLHTLEAEGIPAAQRYTAIRSYLQFRARKNGIPLNGILELTPLCNLDCRMCYVHLHPSQLHGKTPLPTAVWLDLIRQVAKGGMLYAKLTGGECLTHPGFREIYLYLQSLGIETEILSNGVLLHTDMAQFLKEHPPAAVQITLYGARRMPMHVSQGIVCLRKCWRIYKLCWHMRSH